MFEKLVKLPTCRLKSKLTIVLSYKNAIIINKSIRKLQNITKGKTLVQVTFLTLRSSL